MRPMYPLKLADLEISIYSISLIYLDREVYGDQLAYTLLHLLGTGKESFTLTKCRIDHFGRYTMILHYTNQHKPHLQSKVI